MAIEPVETIAKSFEFAEMNIIHSGNEVVTLNMVNRAVLMGYDTVVINRELGDPYAALESNETASDDKEEPPKKKQKRQSGGKPGNVIPDPYLIDPKKVDTTSLEHNGKRFRQFSRVTISLNEQNTLQMFFNNPQLKKYDLIAVCPGNEAIFNTLQRKTDFFDIITYDQSSKVSWLMMSKKLDAIRQEGIAFEISYSSALSDTYSRRMMLSNGRFLLSALRKRGIIFASAARNVTDLRAPYDAMNMLSLLDIEAKSARPYISDFPKNVLLRGESKRSVRGCVAVHSTNSVPSSNLSEAVALSRLLKVPEFRIQIERIPMLKKNVDQIKEEK